MALTKGVNSYVTLAEAEAYFADRVDAVAWFELADDDRKSQALVTATTLLDSLNWDGQSVSETQPLAFPRRISFFDPRLGVDVCTDETPDRMNKATFELAYHLLNNSGILDETGTVESLQLGPISLETVKNASTIPSVVKRFINPMLRNGGSIPVWRSN